jgi:ABC-type multidrug transport system ATPase subunit
MFKKLFQMIVSPQKMKMTVLPSTHKMTDLDSIFPRVVILDIAMHGHKKNMGFYSVLYAYLVLAKSKFASSGSASSFDQ